MNCMTFKEHPSITYFHRNLKAGYSINKVTQTIVSTIEDKEEFYVPCYRFYGVLKNLWFVFRRRNKRGINHVTGDIHYCILALIGCKSVLTIHDAVSIDFIKRSWLSKSLTEWIWFRLPLKFATKVVCISEETKKSILRFTKRKDIKVIYNAVDPIFKSSPKKEINDPLRVLMIGTSPNKNIERTFEALTGTPCELTIVGCLNDSQKNLLNQLDLNYINKTGLSDQEIVDEYEKCDVVSFVSLYEGFGMPVIEANKVGRPVLASRIEVLKEIADNSALFVDPYDVNDIRRGFYYLFNSHEQRDRCVQNGFCNIKRFTDTAIKAQWISLYDDLLK